jgi:hypothetical protein
MPLFVYPIGEIIITLWLVIFSWNQETIIITLGIITTSRIALLSIDIDSIIVRDMRFSGIPVYISLILIGTTTSSPIGI